MEHLVRDEINKIISEADAKLAECLVDQQLGKDLLVYLKSLTDQVRLVNSMLDLMNSPASLSFDLDDLRQEAQVLGYKLYRIRDDIVSELK